MEEVGYHALNAVALREQPEPDVLYKASLHLIHGA